MADENLAKLRTDYEDVFGKKAFNGWNAAQLRAKIDAKLNGDEGDDQAAEPVDNTPRPTQAELDAMRAGAFDRYRSR